MVPVGRISHSTFETPDLPRQVEYYSRVLGFSVLSQTARQAILAGAAGQEVITFEAGTSNRCLRIAFQVSPKADLAAVGSELRKLDLPHETRSDITPAIGKAVVFKDPKGTEIELFAERAAVSIPPVKGGIGPLKLGHLAFSVPDARAISDFYCDALGFRVSDWIEDMFAFLRCGPDHHTVNFVRGSKTFMHHVAYELKDWAHLLTACDILGRERRPIIWGPGRHRVGHNIFVYHRDPDDNIIELYAELDLMKEEELGYFEPRPWHKTNPQVPAVWSRIDAAPVWGLPPSDDFKRNGADHLNSEADVIARSA
jgi:catechol 2,3-dioxygenase-like lactoylglutathione lyase family enzyme